MLSPEFSPELTIVPSDGIRKCLYDDRQTLRPDSEALAPLTERLAIDPITTDLMVTIGDANQTADVFAPPPRIPEKPGRPKGERLDVRVYELTEENILANFAAALMRRDDKLKEPVRAKRALQWGAGATLTELSLAGAALRATGGIWGYVGVTAAGLTLAGAWWYARRPYNIPPLDLDGLQSPLRIEVLKCDDYLDEKEFF